MALSSLCTTHMGTQHLTAMCQPAGSSPLGQSLPVAHPLGCTFVRIGVAHARPSPRSSRGFINTAGPLAAPTGGYSLLRLSLCPDADRLWTRNTFSPRCHGQPCPTSRRLVPLGTPSWPCMASPPSRRWSSSMAQERWCAKTGEDSWSTSTPGGRSPTVTSPKQPGPPRPTCHPTRGSTSAGLPDHWGLHPCSLRRHECHGAAGNCQQIGRAHV